MGNKLKDFRQWLLEKRWFRTAWFAKDPHTLPEPDETLSQLPDDIANELRAAVNDLPINPREEKAVLDALDEAIAHWQENSHLASNSIVVLAHPVSSVSRILLESLQEMRAHKENPLDIKLLDWVERPPDSKSIKAQIKEKLGRAEDNSAEDGETAEINHHWREGKGDRNPNKDQTLAIIPNLSWCFLRSADGLEGVDYLQDTLLHDRSQFWVIGTGQVGWEYLKSTIKFHAYCGDVIALPKLTGQELQTWFAPIVDQFSIRFSDAAIHKRSNDSKSLLDVNLLIDQPIDTISEMSQEVTATVKSSLRAVKEEMLPESDDDAQADSDESPKREFFERLADISDGVSVVAIQLFIKSLRYQDVSAKKLNQKPQKTVAEGRPPQLPKSPDDEPSNQGDSEAEADKEPQKELVARLPKLPLLPELSQSDLYLLYSLMLHGDLTIRSLANSLGDAPQTVNNQVQMLRNAGIIEQKNGVIKANPVHYPRLRRELSRNNFIIEVP